MTFRALASDPTPVPSGTLAELYLDSLDRLGPAPALRWYEEGSWSTFSYGEVAVRVAAAARGLGALGFTRGDRAAILSENRPEWAIADYACLTAGVVDVPVYATLTAAQIAYILEDSGCGLVFVSGGALLDTAKEAIGLTGREISIVSFDTPEQSEPGVMGWTRFLDGADGGAGDGGPIATDADSEWRREALKAEPSDVATLIYTSGTTGDPKGVMLTHNNLFTNVTAAGMRLEITPEDDTLSFLPLCHSLQRMVDYLLFSCGCTIAYARSIDTVPADMRSVRPSIVVSVPRLYEKVHQKVMSASGLRGRLVRWARGVGMRWAEGTLEGSTPSLWTRLAHSVADGLVFKKIREGMGGRMRFFVSGGAPLEPELAVFFFGAGIRILEGYGLTETSPVTNVNTLSEHRVGTVGKPVPSTEIAIAEDGEILVRGPQVMLGYLGKEDETRAAIEEDGWFHTGDIGEIEEGGYLRITDRKKSLFKTSGGKYIAPAPIENRVKTSRFIEHAVVVGASRKFPAIVVVPAFDSLARWAAETGIDASTPPQLMAADAVLQLLASEVSERTSELASYERPKKVGVVLDAFSIEGGQLTPTQKVKRKVVEERYRELIDSFYLTENRDRDVIVQRPR